ncbi:hypothetical protein [Profundibacter sp.]
MNFVLVIVLIGSAVGILFRTMALSPLSTKLTEHRIWVFDFGIRYGWLIIGLVFLAFLASRIGPDQSLFALIAAWLGGLVAIWFLPPFLVTLF